MVMVLIHEEHNRKHTNCRKPGSDDLSLRAGFIASNQGGKPPKSHSAAKKSSSGITVTSLLSVNIINKILSSLILHVKP